MGVADLRPAFSKWFHETSLSLASQLGRGDDQVRVSTAMSSARPAAMRDVCGLKAEPKAVCLFMRFSLKKREVSGARWHVRSAVHHVFL